MPIIPPKISGAARLKIRPATPATSVTGSHRDELAMSATRVSRGDRPEGGRIRFELAVAVDAPCPVRRSSCGRSPLYFFVCERPHLERSEARFPAT